MGGDPGRDPFVAPGDPAFYLHHANMDRVWWMWQQLDRAKRINVVSGTMTMFNLPPSGNGTLDSLLDFPWVGNTSQITMGDLMDTIDGPFCYIYD